jgi:hypothetical protein
LTVEAITYDVVLGLGPAGLRASAYNKEKI